MNPIAHTIGQRLRAHRQQKNMTQEELAEKANLHPTYIGQAERGEKNLTLLSLEKLLSALDISFSEFFEHIEVTTPESSSPSYAAQCYTLINNRSKREQERIYHILCEIDKLIG